MKSGAVFNFRVCKSCISLFQENEAVLQANGAQLRTDKEMFIFHNYFHYLFSPLYTNFNF
jgi:hypothetical protein